MVALYNSPPADYTGYIYTPFPRTKFIGVWDNGSPHPWGGCSPGSIPGTPTISIRILVRGLGWVRPEFDSRQPD